MNNVEKLSRLFPGSAVFLLTAVFALFFLIASCQSNAPKKVMEGNNNQATELFYQGRSSFRLTSKNGLVIYIDPFAHGDYSLPADIVLVTHQHPDHNQVDLVNQNAGCAVISNVEALEGGKHKTFSIKGVTIEAVEAYNGYHDIKEAVGYIITIDGVKVYTSGDTSTTEQMKTFTKKQIDYVLLCCDGIFNMNVQEAGECARIIGAKHDIPVHTHPDFPNGLFDKGIAESFAATAPNPLILEPGAKIKL